MMTIIMTACYGLHPALGCIESTLELYEVLYFYGEKRESEQPPLTQFSPYPIKLSHGTVICIYVLLRRANIPVPPDKLFQPVS